MRCPVQYTGGWVPVVVVVDWWWPPLHTACAEMQKKWMEFYLCGGGQNSTTRAVVLYAPHKKILIYRVTKRMARELCLRFILSDWGM